MKKLINLMALAASMLLAAFYQKRGFIACANAEPDGYDASVVVHDRTINRTNDVAVTARHLLWKAGAGDGSVTLAGLSDAPLGTIDNVEPNTGMHQTVLLLGKGPTKKMTISEPVAPGDELFTAGSGKVSNLSGTAGTYYKVGIAITGGALEGDIIEALDCVPVKVTVA